MGWSYASGSGSSNNADNINAGILRIAYGGTGLSLGGTMAGDLLIGNGTGFTLAGLTGTTNQIDVTNGSGSITLSLPQDIDTGATPTFTSISLTGSQTQNYVFAAPSGSSGAPSFRALVTSDLPDLSSTYQALDSDLTDIAGLTRSRGDLIVGGASAWTNIAVGTSGKFLGTDGTDAAWHTLSGTTNQISISNSSGNLTLSTPQDIHTGASPTFSSISLTGSQTQHTVFAAPSGSSGAPSFRTLVSSDIPDLSGVYQPLDSDLTELAGLTRNRGDLIVGGASAWVDLAIGTTGKFLGTDGTDVAWHTLSGTTNQVSVGNSSGDLTLSLPQSIATTSSVTFGNVTVTPASGTALTLNGGSVSTNSPLITTSQTQSATSGTVTLATLAATFQDGGTNSSTLCRGLYINPTVNFTGSSKTGAIISLLIDHIDTSVPTGAASPSQANDFILCRSGASGTTLKFEVKTNGDVIGYNDISAVNNMTGLRTRAINGSGQGISIASDQSGVQLGSTYQVGWNSTAAFNGTIDTTLSRFGAGILGLSNSTTATAFRVFNTTDSTTSPTNAEWLEAAWSGNVCTIQTTKSGSGTLRALALTSGSGSWSISSAGAIASAGITATGNVIPSADSTYTLGTSTSAGRWNGGYINNVFSDQILSPIFNPGNTSARIQSGQYYAGTSAAFFWTNSSAQAGTPDTSLSRNAAGVIQFGTGSANLSGSWKATSGTVETANGAQTVIATASESLTLSTSGTTTDTSANLLPANAIILSVTTRVTTTITTAANYSVGDSTTSNRFANAVTSITSGSTNVGLDQMQGGVTTNATGPVQTSATPVRITTNATPGAGVIRITVHYMQFVAPTS